MRDAGGKCVLNDVEGLDNLPLYFQSSYGYMFPRDTALPFEVKAVKLSTIYRLVAPNRRKIFTRCLKNGARKQATGHF